MARTDTLFLAVIALSAASMAATYVYKSLRAPTGPAPTGLASGDTRLARVSNIEEQAADVGIRVGPQNASIELVEFSDLQCPFCKVSHEAVRGIMRAHPGEVAYTFIHYPLQSHRFAIGAARAAECARRQGMFIELVDDLFAQQDSFGTKAWTRFAQEVDIPDAAGYAACVEESGEVPAIRDGIALGRQINVRGTPTVLINGWKFERPPAPRELERFVGLLLSGGIELTGARDTFVLRTN